MPPSHALPTILLVAACSQVAALVHVDVASRANETQPPGSERLAEGAANAAGCVEKKTSLTLEELGGQYPASEFANMLATRIAPMWYDERRDTILKEKLKRPWCPKPIETPMFVDEDKEVFSYLDKALAGTKNAKPLVVSVVELSNAAGDHHMVQVSNFLCGLRRLNLEQRVAVLALSNETATFLRRQFPDLRVLWHPALIESIDRFSRRTNVGLANRVAKLVLAALLVEQGREVLVGDIDQYWAQDPIPFLRSLRTPQGKAIEFAAMKDLCWLELNSGFLYYKPTDRTKAMLKSALSTVRFSEMIDGKLAEILSDNDQYILNCGFARTAVSGLDYVILPAAQFHFGDAGFCHSPDEASRHPTPLVWHTSGFTTNYAREMDTFSAAGMLDIDPDKGTCKPGLRGADSDVSAWNSTWNRMCVATSEGGIGASICFGACRPEGDLLHAEGLLRKYLRGWPMPSKDVKHFRNSVEPPEVALSDGDLPAFAPTAHGGVIQVCTVPA